MSVRVALKLEEREQTTYILEVRDEPLHSLEFANLPRGNFSPSLSQTLDMRNLKTVNDLHHSLEIGMTIAFLQSDVWTISLRVERIRG